MKAHDDTVRSHTSDSRSAGVIAASSENVSISPSARRVIVIDAARLPMVEI